jgi:hypothetical protein
MRSRAIPAVCFLLVGIGLKAQSVSPPDAVPLRNWSPAQPAVHPDATMSIPLVPATPSLLFMSMPACRMIDTRASQGFAAPFGPPAIVGGALPSRTFPILTNPTCPLPGAALAVSLNITAVPTLPFQATTLAVYPTPSGPDTLPSIFTLNVPAGVVTLSNAAVVEVGNAGLISIFSNLKTDVIVDVNGFYVAAPAQGSLVSMNFLPGTAPGSIAVGRNVGTNPGEPFLLQSGSPAAGGTDLAGGAFMLAAGPGTGLGGGGNLQFQTAGANDLSGTSDNLLVDREIVVARAKQLTLSAPGFASLMSIHLVGTHTAGGRIYYTIRATDGGSQIATEEGVIQFLATANSIICTVQSNDKVNLGTVNSGCTPGFFNPGFQPGITIFDNVSFGVPAPIVVHDVYFRIVNESGSAIRLEP